MLKNKTLNLFLIFVVSTQVHATIDTFNRKTILKTNLLNIPIVPSLHLEQQIGASSSLQLNIHRGSLEFFGQNEWLDISINYRKYFGKNILLNRFYGAVGIASHYDLLQSRYNYGTQEIYKGDMSIGPEIRIGYQKQIKKSRWHFDTNIGAAFAYVPLLRFGNGYDSQVKVFLGMGYQISQRSVEPVNF